MITHDGLNKSVEVFRFDSVSLELFHTETIAHKLITSPFAIHSLAHNLFIFTNLNLRSGVIRLWDFLLTKDTASVIVSIEERFKPVIKGRMTGISVSQDQKLVFIGGGSKGVVHVYERTISNGLRLVDTLNVVYR